MPTINPNDQPSEERPGVTSAPILKSWVNSLIALLLTLIAPGSGHYWYGDIVKALVFPVLLLLSGAVFSWSGVLFDPVSLPWLVGVWGGIYGGALFSVLLISRQKGRVPVNHLQLWLVVPAILILFGIVFKFKAFFYGFQLFYIPSQSMVPVLNVGDMVMVDVRQNTLIDVTDGDIIVFTRPDSDEFLIKRVLAKPGDKITLQRGTLTINDVQILAGLDSAGEQHQIMSQDSYFVMGDNHHNSFDSRHWGAVKRARLVGLYRYTLFSFGQHQQ